MVHKMWRVSEWEKKGDKLRENKVIAGELIWIGQKRKIEIHSNLCLSIWLAIWFESEFIFRSFILIIVPETCRSTSSRGIEKTGDSGGQ